MPAGNNNLLTNYLLTFMYFLALMRPNSTSMKRLVYSVIIFLFPLLSFSQSFQRPHTGQIKTRLKKLNVLTSVLYVAAHPDDENTRIITAMANDKLATTAYLSMTRGDGGQNLIGPEMRDVLGLIRTQELLTARRIDGGEQFFTRANDFGFSKSADETFTIWGKDAITQDVITVYRQFQPDVIITRFPPDERAGHGHHTASAILAQEAFDQAADATVFPALTKEYGVWQAKRLYTNTGRWWNTTINENTPGIITLNVGGYSALLGESYSEIAARSRSQHKSQGFGSRGTRGDQLEFLEFIKGEKAVKDIFEGVNTSWSRVKGSEKVQALVLKAIKEFNEEDPAATVPTLIKLRKEILALNTSVWKDRKVKEVEQLIQDCLGLFIDVTADKYWAAPGHDPVIAIEVVNRSASDVSIEKISSSVLGFDSTFSLPLKNNIPLLIKTSKKISPSTPYSDPYWLREPHSTGLFTVSDKKLIGKPENDPAVMVVFTIRTGGENLTITRPLHCTWTDPVKGEASRPFEVVPPVFVSVQDKVMVISDTSPKEVRVMVTSSGGSVKGTLKLRLPAGWRSEPAAILFELANGEEEQVNTFRIFPAAEEITAVLNVVAEVDGKIYDKSVQTITYDHIPTQLLLPTASAKLVRINLKKEGGLIGYIKGAGDDVPAALRHIGYEVWEMKDEEVVPQNLKRLDAVVLGVRALNTNGRIHFMMKDLLEYVKQGGTMVVQYNTNSDLEATNFSPYPLNISRDRVTQEDSDVRILKPDHSLLNTPNKITTSDFTGWVQERGLYFPDKWDPHFEAVFSMNDKGEKAKEGSLLVAKYGNGHYIYTGLSFFRELPEGVAGAYKLFANMVSLGKGGARQ
jgi:LmbE family N-acetylglucosaminyl deacetylase